MGYTFTTRYPRFGIVSDYTHSPLNTFIKEVIKTYTNRTFADTRCGYACSDHASAKRYGFPSTMVLESGMEYANPFIHTTVDTIKKMDPDQMMEHAKLVVEFVLELAFAEL